MKTSEDYYTDHMSLFEPFSWTGGAPRMHILPKAIGRKWDNYVLGALHAYNPTSIRVTNGWIKCDARRGRITVIVDANNIIKEITQEVYVGIPYDKTEDGVENNHELVKELI